MSEKEPQPSSLENPLLPPFAQVYQENLDKIINYVAYRTGNRELATDIAEDTFLRAAESWSTYENRGVPVTAWLYTLAHSVMINHFRDENRHNLHTAFPIDHTSRHEADTTIDPDAVSLETPLLEAEHSRDFESALISSILKIKSRKQKEALWYTYILQFSNEEIAAVTGSNEDAIKTLKARAYDNVLNNLLADYPDLDEVENYRTSKSRLNLPTDTDNEPGESI